MKVTKVSNSQAIFLCKYYAAKVMKVDIDQTYMVWFSKTLQNFKAMISTDAVSGKYVEATYNGDKDELYIDLYDKETNSVFAHPAYIFEKGAKDVSEV